LSGPVTQALRLGCDLVCDPQSNSLIAENRTKIVQLVAAVVGSFTINVVVASKDQSYDYYLPAKTDLALYLRRQSHSPCD